MVGFSSQSWLVFRGAAYFFPSEIGTEDPRSILV